MKLLRVFSLALCFVSAASAQFDFNAFVESQTMTEGATPTFFIGTHTGLYQSSDDRQTWTPIELLPFGHQPPDVVQVLVDPQRATRLYAATQTPGAGVFRSDDSGETWTQKTTGLPADDAVFEIYVSDIDDGPIYARLKDGQQFDVYKSIDRGENWAFLVDLPNGATQLQIHPLNPDLWFYTEPRRVYRSTDEGQTWMDTAPFPVESDNMPGVQNSVSAIRVDPNSQNQLLMATSGPRFAPPEQANGTFFSDDQAATWKRIVSDIGHRIEYTAGPTLVYRSETASVRVSNDRGRTFAGPFEIMEGSGGDQAMMADLRDTGTLYFGLFVSDDAGRTWTRETTTFTPTFGTPDERIRLRGSRNALAPTIDVISVRAFGLATSAIPYTVVAPSEPWLVLDVIDDTLSGTIRIQADPRGLDPGEYEATVTLMAPQAFNPEATFKVVLEVTDEPVPISTPTILTFAGDGGFGLAGDGGPAVDATLGGVEGLEFSGEYGLLISDSSQDVVRSVDAEAIIRRFAGTGTSGFSGDGGPATQAQLDSPRDVAVGPDDSVYISDGFNRRIRRVAANGMMSTYAGSGEIGVNDPTGNNSQLSLLPGALAAAPDGGLFAKGSVYRLDPNGTYERWSIRNPDGLFVGPDGFLYGAFGSESRVAIIRSNGSDVTVAGTGTPGYGGDGGPATEALLDGPEDVVVDAEGRIFVADSDNNVVRVIENGIISTYAGTGAAGYSGDGGPANRAELDEPNALALGPNGELYISDRGNRRIRVVQPPGTSTHEVTAVFDAAGGQALISPGAIVSVYGAFTNTTALADSVPLGTDLNGFSVTFNDIPGALFGFFDGAFDQSNVQVPWNVDVSSGTVAVKVHWQDANGSIWSEPFEANAALASPGIYMYPPGTTQAIVTNFKQAGDDVVAGSWAQPTGSVGIAAEQAAAIGGVATLWANGLGPVSPVPATGDLPQPPGTSPVTDKVVRVFVGDVPAQVLGAVLQSQSVGLNQINIIIPEGVTPGDAVPIVIEVECPDGTKLRSREDATIAVRSAPQSIAAGSEGAVP